MAKFNTEKRILEFESSNHDMRISEVQKQLPAVPIEVYKLTGDLFRASCLDYKFQCLSSILPYCRNLYLTFQGILWVDPKSRSEVKDFASARDFYSKLSTSGAETQLVSRAAREKLQVVQFASQALSDYPLLLDDVKSILLAKVERSNLATELDKLMHSPQWSDYSLREQRRKIEEFELKRDSVTPMVFKILLLNARHLSNDDRVQFLFSDTVSYKDALKKAVKSMRIRELNNFYKSPSNYVLPLVVS